MNAAPASAARPGVIAVIGETLADVFPDASVLGGAPFNVARALGAFGLAPLLVTRCGRDALGREVAAECARFGVRADGLQSDDSLPTGVVEVALTPQGHRFTIRPDQAWDAIDAGQASAVLSAAAPAWLCFGTLAQRRATSRAAIHAALAAVPGKRLLDLNLREMPEQAEVAEQSLTRANWLKLNEDELLQLFRWFTPRRGTSAEWSMRAVDARIAHLAARFDLEQVIVTRGAAGYAAFNPRGICTAMGMAPTVTVRDTVGAGDAFTAVLLYGLQAGWPLPATLQRASEFSAAVCTLRGAVADEPGFYRGFIERWQVRAA